MKLEPHDVRRFATPADLREWFDANHATADELWLGYYWKGSGRPSVTWSEAVDEARRMGWVDGPVSRIDEAGQVQRFTPRRKRSARSRANVKSESNATEPAAVVATEPAAVVATEPAAVVVAEVAAVEAQDPVRSAGVPAMRARSMARTGIHSRARPAEALAEEEIARFRADPAAWTDWAARPPSYREAATHWVTSARPAATRERRLTALIEDSKAERPTKPLAWTRRSA